jgi:hypothetical protein
MALVITNLDQKTLLDVKTILFVVILPIFLTLTVLLGVMRTQFVQAAPAQSLFLKGRAELPSGLYRGSVQGIKFAWKGKIFDKKVSRGVNIFGSDLHEKYPFTFYLGKGLQDPKKDVVKIDYNLKENPFWMKWILDEVIEYEPNKYVGKLHIRLIPYIPITLGYFYLER